MSDIILEVDSPTTVSDIILEVDSPTTVSMTAESTNYIPTGEGVTQAYVDGRDAATLASAEAYADAHGDKAYTHTQSTAASTWTIAHGLGKHPSVTVVDSAGTEVMGDVVHVDTNTVRLEFSAPFSGHAYLN